MIISKASQRDILSIIAIHKNEFPNDFLPSLGDDFLEIIYLSGLNSINSIIFVAKINNKIVGFVIGVLSYTQFLKFTIYHNFFLVIKTLFLRCLTKPSVFFRILETLLYSSKTSKVNSEILAVAVDKKNKRNGIGTKLINKLEEYFKKKGIRIYKVSTLQSIRTAKFYNKLKFKYKHSFNLYGKKWNLYLKKI